MMGRGARLSKSTRVHYTIASCPTLARHCHHCTTAAAAAAGLLALTVSTGRPSSHTGFLYIWITPLIASCAAVSVLNRKACLQSS